MDNAAINLAMAERLQLTPHAMERHSTKSRSYHTWTEWRDPSGKVFRADFATSLDAMAEAEATLTPDERRDYIEALRPRHIGDDNILVKFWFEVATASARTRALAFLVATKNRARSQSGTTRVE